MRYLYPKQVLYLIGDEEKRGVRRSGKAHKEVFNVKIRITWHSGEVTALLNSTPTTSKLKAALPVESRANRWGKEVYFEVPFEAKLERDAKEVVEPGTVCFWVEGKSLAIPFGPTPISKGDECRLVTRVNILGLVEGNPSLLDSIKEGDRIRVEAG